MSHLSVNVTKRVKIEGKGLRDCPVAIAANGKIKPDVVLVDGKEATHSEGAYSDGAKLGVLTLIDRSYSFNRAVVFPCFT